jgi:pyruvate/2-oxoglutarate dehydrogenase complex dihydrolipoamide acyltransferase (E2) component
MAKDMGINIDGVVGTGEGGRVLHGDLLITQTPEHEKSNESHTYSVHSV